MGMTCFLLKLGVLFFTGMAFIVFACAIWSVTRRRK